MSTDYPTLRRGQSLFRVITPWRVVAVLTLALMTFPYLVGWGILSMYVLHLTEVVLLWALAAAALNLLVGYTGPESLAHGALFGVGGFATAVFSMQLGIPVLVSILLGSFLSVGMALLIALPSLRLGGAYFVILTIAFQLIYQDSLLIFEEWTGGLNGLAGIPSVPGAFGFPAIYVDFYLVLFAVVISLYILYRLVHSGIGDTLEMIKQDEGFAEHLGYNTTRYKVMAFLISAFFVGLAGGLYAQHNAFMGRTLSNIFVSFHILVYVIVGGAGYFWGPVGGAIGINLAQELTNIASVYSRILMATLFLLVILFAPNGISGLIERWRESGMNITGRSEEQTIEEADD